MTEQERVEALTKLSEQADTLCLDFDLDAAIASKTSVDAAYFWVLEAVPSVHDRALIRAGQMSRPILNLAERSRWHA